MLAEHLTVAVYRIPEAKDIWGTLNYCFFAWRLCEVNWDRASATFWLEENFSEPSQYFDCSF